MGIDDTSNIVLGSLRYKSSQDKGVFLNHIILPCEFMFILTLDR